MNQKIQIAKEYVKFNERSMIRLLGDMRAYNYVVVPTHDFDQVVYKIRQLILTSNHLKVNFLFIVLSFSRRIPNIGISS